ncbi:hypothetical protein CAI21_15485 [Alkalilimnicola ehrlichii]|uniref:Uncharacterized protein n=1 Tax=Alkalilimnicola ehrlichii TaxID=351052 RepID=A0A3E0WQ19_9GAMM|nr:hypothetical protein [Alkalilimnicola ehrlichii]RFA26968.1 hypothetical protein CAI21_15485 [Alkalilimnicola ehrlichii]RFA34086.1 hypothetical protein CAL65_15620 [Alkalilimnicola ehrlichii]
MTIEASDLDLIQEAGHSADFLLEGLANLVNAKNSLGNDVAVDLRQQALVLQASDLGIPPEHDPAHPHLRERLPTAATMPTPPNYARRWRRWGCEYLSYVDPFLAACSSARRTSRPAPGA